MEAISGRDAEAGCTAATRARRYLSDLADAWEFGLAAIDAEAGVGDVAVLAGRMHHRGKGSGVESEVPLGWTLGFREGKLIRFQAFKDPAQALEAAGLSDQPDHSAL